MGWGKTKEARVRSFEPSTKYICIYVWSYQPSTQQIYLVLLTLYVQTTNTHVFGLTTLYEQQIRWVLRTIYVRNISLLLTTYFKNLSLVVPILDEKKSMGLPTINEIKARV